MCTNPEAIIEIGVLEDVFVDDVMDEVEFEQLLSEKDGFFTVLCECLTQEPVDRFLTCCAVVVRADKQEGQRG